MHRGKVFDFKDEAEAFFGPGMELFQCPECGNWSADKNAHAEGSIMSTEDLFLGVICGYCHAENNKSAELNQRIYLPVEELQYQ